MPKYTRNSGKQWTPSEVTQLRTLASENTPTRVIGRELGRPVGGVYAKASETVAPPSFEGARRGPLGGRSGLDDVGRRISESQRPPSTNAPAAA